MGRRSTISRLPPDVRSQIDRWIREGTCTLDELKEHVSTDLGVEIPRSTLGAYKKRMEQQLKRYREAQEIAGTWVAGLGELEDSQLGQLLAEMLKMIAFQTMSGAGEDGYDPKDLHFSARALKDLASAEKTMLEIRTRVRDEWRAELAERAQAAQEEVAQVAKSAGLTPEAEARIREIVLGVVS